VRVCRAADTKSCVFMNVSKGGFESGEKDFDTVGGGSAHSSVMEEGSSVPRILEGWREFLIKEGAWISL
jgi:hypothetical protein